MAENGKPFLTKICFLSLRKDFIRKYNQLKTNTLHLLKLELLLLVEVDLVEF